VRESLALHKGSLAAQDLERLIDQVHFFGFHLAKLDFRDHGRKLRQIFSELFPEEPFEKEWIVRKILSPVKIRSAALSAQSKDLLEQLAALRYIQDRIDPLAAEDYIISMTEKPADILMLFIWLNKRD